MSISAKEGSIQNLKSRIALLEQNIKNYEEEWKNASDVVMLNQDRLHECKEFLIKLEEI